MTIGHRRILLVVPKLVRDLEGHALIAYHLRNSFGHDVRLYTGPNTTQMFLDFRPDALVLDFLSWDERAREAELAKQVGAKVCVLPTAGVFPNEQGFLRGVGEATGAYRFADCYLSWGEYAAQAIHDRQLLPRDRVEVVGCPRFDFYARPQLAGLRDRATHLHALGVQNPEAPVLLWCTNTPEYNNLEQNPERYVTCMRDSGAGEESWLRREVDDQREQLQVHSGLVAELAAHHPEWNFLVKVHPLEHRSFYYQWVRGKLNIFVVPNAPIGQFLFHCDVLMQRGCTTATESWTLRKPVLELALGDFQIAWSTNEQSAGNHSVHTFAEAEQAITYYLDGGAIPEQLARAREAFLNKFYYRVDGYCSLRCAERIHLELVPPRYSDEQQALTRRLTEKAALDRTRENKRKPLGLLKHVLGVGQHRTLRPWKRSFWMPSQRIATGTIAALYRRYDAVFNDQAVFEPPDRELDRVITE